MSEPLTHAQRELLGALSALAASGRTVSDSFLQMHNDYAEGLDHAAPMVLRRVERSGLAIVERVMRDFRAMRRLLRNEARRIARAKAAAERKAARERARADDRAIANAEANRRTIHTPPR